MSTFEYAKSDCINSSFRSACYFFIKAFMLGITMQLDISAWLTPQVTTIIYHHEKSIIKKN